LLTAGPASRTSATPSARLACAREAGGGDFKSAIRPRRLRISTQLRRIRNQRVRNCRKHGRHFLSIFIDFSRPCGAPSSAELVSELPSRLGAGIRGIFEGFYRIWKDFRRILKDFKGFGRISGDSGRFSKISAGQQARSLLKSIEIHWISIEIQWKITDFPPKRGPFWAEVGEIWLKSAKNLAFSTDFGKWSS